MPAILKTEMSSVNAAQFLDALYSNTSTYYIGIGRQAEWPNENVPPAPVNTINAENDFRDNLIGIKRANVENAMLLVPRVAWEVGKVYNVLKTNTVASKRALDYFIINSLNMVYECVSSPGSATLAGAEPTTKGTAISTSDGYTWKYLYTVTNQMVDNGLLLETWMPVPYNTRGVYPGGTLTEDQSVYGDLFANVALGAYRVILLMKFEDEGEVLPYDIAYRQIGVLTDPKDNSNNYIEGDIYKTSEFDKTTGHLVYLENRRPIYREPGQIETIQLILVF